MQTEVCRDMDQTCRRGIFSSSWFIMFLLIPFLKPESINNIPIVSTGFALWQVVSILAIIVLFLKSQDGISKFLILTGVYQGCLLLATVIYTHKVGLGLRRMLTALFLCALIEIACRADARCLVESIYKVLWMWVLANFVSVVYAGSNQGNEIMYFLGIRVTFTYVMITALAVGFLCMEYERKKYRLLQLVLTGMILFSVIRVWVATGLLAVILVLGLYGAGRILPELKKIFTYKRLMLLGIFLNIGIILFRIQNVFEFIIVGLLHKSLTFTGRTALWNHALELIKQRIIIGYGVASVKIQVPEMGDDFSIYYGHSQLIQILIEGGLTGAVLFLGMIYLCGRMIQKHQNSNMAFILAGCMFANIIIMITEVPAYYSYYFIILALGCNVEYLVHAMEVKKGLGGEL